MRPLPIPRSVICSPNHIKNIVPVVSVVIVVNLKPNPGDKTSVGVDSNIAAIPNDHSLGDADQGIVHAVGPQLGLTQPGMTVVCGDSHTSTHGAFGALAFGIGTSQVKHVLATQTLPIAPSGP